MHFQILNIIGGRLFLLGLEVLEDGGFFGPSPYFLASLALFWRTPEAIPGLLSNLSEVSKSVPLVKLELINHCEFFED